MHQVEKAEKDFIESTEKDASPPTPTPTYTPTPKPTLEPTPNPTVATASNNSAAQLTDSTSGDATEQPASASESETADSETADSETSDSDTTTIAFANVTPTRILWTRVHVDSSENDTSRDVRLHKSCSYLAWLHVSMYTNGTNVQRCAYMYGTRANSWTGYSQTSKLLDAAPIGDDRTVWVLHNDPKLCVVGVQPLQQLVNRVVYFLST